MPTYFYVRLHFIVSSGSYFLNHLFSTNNSSDTTSSITFLYIFNASVFPTIISSNLSFPFSLRKTKSIFFALDESNSFPLSNVIGFALPVTAKPNVALVFPAANASFHHRATGKHIHYTR